MKEQRNSRIKDIVLMLTLSLFITLGGLSMSAEGLSGVLREWAAQPVLIVLNLWPVFAVGLTFAFLFGNVFAGAAIAAALEFFLTYVNLLKIEGRDDVLIASDITLIREAAQAASDYGMNLHIPMVVMAVAAVCALLCLAVRFRKRRIPLKQGCAFAFITVIVFALFLKPVYFTYDIFNRLQKENEYHLARVYEQLGFNYAFLHCTWRYTSAAVTGYSRGEVEGWISEYTTDTEEKETPFTPNIVIIMCEAFTDFCDEDVFAYTEADNPIRDYHAVALEENSISGQMLITSYGAGTTCTEFDVLTGMQAGEFRATSIFREVRKETDSLATFLHGYGYHSYFMHPGDDWFYNRKNVYRYFGFDEQVYKQEFGGVITEYNGIISDKDFTARLIEDMRTRIEESDTPLFAYTTTFENHQAYPADKYDDGIVELPVSVDIPEEVRAELQTYFTGLKHGAKALKEITDYFDTVGEPVITVFFGDHKANINASYEALGYKDRIASSEADDILWAYGVPYLVHVNRAYAQEKDVAAIKQHLDLPENGVISDNFLPEILLEMSTGTQESPWFTFLKELRRKYPVVRGWQDFYMDMEGNALKVPDAEGTVLTDRFNKWEWYLLKD